MDVASDVARVDNQLAVLEVAVKRVRKSDQRCGRDHVRACERAHEMSIHGVCHTPFESRPHAVLDTRKVSAGDGIAILPFSSGPIASPVRAVLHVPALALVQVQIPAPRDQTRSSMDEVCLVLVRDDVETSETLIRKGRNLVEVGIRGISVGSSYRVARSPRDFSGYRVVNSD